MAKVIAAVLLSLFTVTPVVAFTATTPDTVTVYLSFVFYKDKMKDKTVDRSIIVGGASLAECQGVFKAFLAGVDGGATQDFSVSSCKPYTLGALPQS